VFVILCKNTNLFESKKNLPKKSVFGVFFGMFRIFVLLNQKTIISEYKSNQP